jgi:hypothetical protein
LKPNKYETVYKLKNIFYKKIFFALPGSAGLSQISPNGLTLLLSLHPEQVHRSLKKLEAAQLICIQPAILQKLVQV